jgi:hypothetical protein
VSPRNEAVRRRGRSAAARDLERRSEQASGECAARLQGRASVSAIPHWRALFDAALQAGMAEAYRKAAAYADRES